MMRMVTMRGVATTAEMRSLLEHKLDYALDRFGRWIHRVEVAIEDVNGPRGGSDKRCRVLLTVPRHRDVVVEERGADLATVLSSAVDRAAAALDRIRGRKQMQHKGLRHSSDN